MKRFPHIISKLLYEPVMITPSKHGAICQVIAMHETGVKISSDDDPQDHDADMTEVGNMAIIPVHGIIDQHIPDSPSGGDGCDLDDVNSMIEVARSDKSISRIIFDFRTPGGCVTGVAETASRIARIEDKTTIAFCDSECCSAGLWLASQCQKFYSTGSASIGSVGVWCAYLDISRQMQNEGQNMQAIFAGKYKIMGAYWKALSDEEKGIIQKSVDKIYYQFKTAMGTHRTVTEDNFGNGLVFDGEEAAQMGFTDGVMDSLEDLLEMDWDE